ncbi:MAG: hypothetical protein WCQ44_04970 [Opitutaceae bacterium]
MPARSGHRDFSPTDARTGAYHHLTAAVITTSPMNSVPGQKFSRLFIP